MVCPEPGLQAGEEALRGLPDLGSVPAGLTGSGGCLGEGPGQSCRPTGAGPACLAGSSLQLVRWLRASTAPGQRPSPSQGNPGGKGWHVMPHGHRGRTRRASRLLRELLWRQGKHHGCGHPLPRSCVAATQCLLQCKHPLGMCQVFSRHKGSSQREEPWRGCVFAPVSRGPL